MLIGAIAFVFVIAAIAVAAFYFSSSNRTSINSVPVLPFANTSGDPNAEYLSDGITEGIIDKLSGLPSLKVISRTSAFRYKQREIEPQKVAKELGVEALVMGRVIQRGDDLSVSAELVDAREDKQLWGEQYRRKLADINYVQQEIATDSIYEDLDDTDEAFRLIEKGYAQHSAIMPWLAADVFWYGMRSDPRYADLLRRIGLPQ